MRIQVGMADDHQLFLKSLSALINTFSGYEVTLEALHGEELLRKLATVPVKPEILLIDVDMQVMDGPRTAAKITQDYPGIRTIALSMKDDDSNIIRMLKAGCCAYLLKDIHPDELEKALAEVHARGFYNADEFNVNYRRLILKANEEQALALSDRERQFLELASSDLTYKEIAAQLFLSERTIDGYRESLFEKMNVKSRVGMVLEGLRKGIIKL